MELCSVAEGKRCLRPHACSAAVPIPGRQHRGPGTFPPGDLPIPGHGWVLHVPSDSSLGAVLCSCWDSVCGEGQVIVKGVQVPAWQCRVPRQAWFAAALLLWLDPKQGSFASCCCAGKDESFPDSAEWEQRLLEVQHCQKAGCREVSACLKEPRSHTGQEQPLKRCCGAAARLCGAASSSLSQAQGGS